MVDKPLRAKVSWDTHFFALVCMRKRLLTRCAASQASAEGPADPASASEPVENAAADAAAPDLYVGDEEGAASIGLQGLSGEIQEDEEAKADIPDSWCETVDDNALLGLVELLEYIDISRAPANWTALLIRTLLLHNKHDEARAAFAAKFANSLRVQELAWRKPVVAPAAWLSDVAEHVAASKVLLRVLSDFRDMDAEAVCDLIEHVLLANFFPLAHCGRALLSSELINEVVGACFDAARKAKAPREVDDETGRGGEPQRRCPKRWAGEHVLWRLHHVGTRLFNAAFVPQCGFLPHKWPDCLDDDELSKALPIDHADGLLVGSPLCVPTETLSLDVERCCRLEPLRVDVTGHCLWDEGLLTIHFLHHIMDVGRASPQGATLCFGRRVIMRHLWYTYHGSYSAIPELQALWELACWPLCKDAGLIHEALEYLKGVYREQQEHGGPWCPNNEEALFRMFAALDLSRLPGQSLVSPWVPAQVQAVRLLVQQQPAERFASELLQEVATATESLKSVNAQCNKLSSKLDVVEQRTVINKSQINDALVAIEEQQKKRTPAVPAQRGSNGTS